MKRFTLVIAFTVTIFSMILAGPALAHEFILKPVQFNAPVGHQLPFSIVSAHVFMISEEMEPIDQVEVQLMGADIQKKVALKPNNMLLTLDGKVEISKEGSSILCGHRKGIIWTKTTKGWKQASKKALTGVISSGKYEKFCKTLIINGKSDDGFKRIVGHKLEIVPVDDPGKVQMNEDLAFKVLFDDNPLTTEVFASYDGFSSNPNTYAYYTETNEKGIAKVKITQRGTWMVRVQHKVDKSADDFDTHVMRAIFVFGVS
ncbi:MAG: DUF4198 domain-containing protein [Desulfobacteraceae bacterium]|nr:DUF4198 domain-containing protein [Desulfobacteraceae bacterium]